MAIWIDGVANTDVYSCFKCMVFYSNLSTHTFAGLDKLLPLVKL